MAIFSSKTTLQLPTESIWDYVLGTKEQVLSRMPVLVDANDPDSKYLSATGVARQARDFAKKLTDVGVQAQDRVLFVYPASIFSAPFFLATHLIGATFIPLSAEITPSELQVTFEHSKPTAIVFQPGCDDLGRTLEVSSELPSPSLLCLDSSTQSPCLYNLTPENNLLEGNDDQQHAGTQITPPASSPCLILYTSGTSGKPKGWIYTEETLLAALEGYVAEMKRPLTADEGTQPAPKVLLGQVPHHCTGFMTPLVCLRTLVPVYLTRDCTAEGLLAKVKACGISDVRTRGSTVLDMSNLADAASLAALRLLRRIRAAGSPLSFKVIQDVVRLAQPMRLRVENAYGCTELGGLATWDPQRPIDSSSVGELYAGIVGKVVSTDDGRTLPPSTPGEIYVKGPVAPAGYYNDAAATRNLLTADGWLRTGDFGLIREDGNVFIIDRLKDLIKVRGHHVSATELEDLIMTNPNVTDVAVIGVAVNNDEGPRAYVVRAEGTQIQGDDVARFVAERVPPAKRLSGGVKIVSKLPRSEAGKVLRRALREWAVAELGDTNGNYHAESSAKVHELSRDYSSAIRHLNTLPSNAAAIEQALTQRNNAAPPIQNMRSWVKILGLEIGRLDSLRAIHLAGTKGKGSAAAMLESILLEHDRSSTETKPLRIGVYTSPHIEFVRERIRIDGAAISESDFAEAFFRLWDQVHDVDERERPFLSFFSFLTLLMFQVFLDKGVDCAIVETGIGGLDDPTNILPHPHVTAITRLDLDHVNLLGRTLERLPATRAGSSSLPRPLWQWSKSPRAYRSSKHVRKPRMWR